MKNKRSTKERAIYNCHIHTFTFEHTPRKFFLWALANPISGKISIIRIFLVILAVLLLSFLILARWLTEILGSIAKISSTEKSPSRISNTLSRLQERINIGARKSIKRRPILSLIGRINPAPNDFLERYAGFLRTALLGSQAALFQEAKDQYPSRTKFIVLPMNLEFMGDALGKPPKNIDKQHAELLCLANRVNGKQEEDKVIYPFFTVHPEQEDWDKIINKMNAGRIFGKDKFRGLKIYPNLGYKPTHEKLMEVYAICEKRNVPVMTHCTPTGIWKFGLSEAQRRDFGNPENYTQVLSAYQKLRICLAHFGGAEEWAKHLRRDTLPANEAEAGLPWVKIIYEMIKGGKFPNLYTDISYTVFTPKVKGLYIDLIDYLKVLLSSNTNVREHVLFGSDYYMVEQEKLAEKEVSILLRSRLGEDLFFQIANKNPRRFLGIR